MQFNHKTITIESRLSYRGRIMALGDESIGGEKPAKGTISMRVHLIRLAKLTLVTQLVIAATLALVAIAGRDEVPSSSLYGSANDNNGPQSIYTIRNKPVSQRGINQAQSPATASRVSSSSSSEASGSWDNSLLTKQPLRSGIESLPSYRSSPKSSSSNYNSDMNDVLGIGQTSTMQGKMKSDLTRTQNYRSGNLYTHWQHFDPLVNLPRLDEIRARHAARKGGDTSGKSSSSSSSSRTSSSSSSSPVSGGGVKRHSPKTILARRFGPKSVHQDRTRGKGIQRNRPNQHTNATLEPRALAGKKKNLVCYYGSWAVYRPDNGKYPVENIDPFLCTHVIYGFAGLSFDNMIKPLDPWNDLEDNYGKGAFKRFTNLKRKNPDLKTLIAIGGWNEGSIKYSKMASDPDARAKFVRSVLDFIQKYNFDGLDLDWEYPGSRGGQSYDKANFVKLLSELRQAFDARGYLLTAAVSAGKWFIDPAYDIPQVSKYLDFINLMTYDYHGGWEPKTGMNAPLFASKKYDLSPTDMTLNVNWSVNYWLRMGAPREKIMLGVGSYGRSFTLDRAQVNGINAPASQKGQAGPYTREPGSLGYNEICESFLRQPRSWTIVREPDYLAPYAFNDRQWVGYDDRESIALKAQYSKSMGLGGVMMWSIETDDFHGRCHNEKYPLLNTIRRVLDGTELPPPSPAPPGTPSTAKPVPTPAPTPAPAPAGKPSTTTSITSKPIAPTSTPNRPCPPGPVTPSSTTTTGREVEDDVTVTSTRRPYTQRPATARPPVPSTTVTTTTVAPPTGGDENNGANNDGVCRADGLFPYPKNCRKFIRCVGTGTSQARRFVFDCAPGTAFSEEMQACDHLYNVPRCGGHFDALRMSPLQALDQPADWPFENPIMIEKGQLAARYEMDPGVKMNRYDDILIGTPVPPKREQPRFYNKPPRFGK